MGQIRPRACSGVFGAYFVLASPPCRLLFIRFCLLTDLADIDCPDPSVVSEIN